MQDWQFRQVSLFSGSRSFHSITNWVTYKNNSVQNLVLDREAATGGVKKETLAQVFSCELRETACHGRLLHSILVIRWNFKIFKPFRNIVLRCFPIFCENYWMKGQHGLKIYSGYVGFEISILRISINENFRSRYRIFSIKKDVLKNFAKFRGKHLCQSLFLNKVAGVSNFCRLILVILLNYTIRSCLEALR